MRVDELMTTPAITCRANEMLEEAAHKMWSYDLGAIAIVNDSGTLVGMLTDRDICMAALMNGSALHRVPIHVAMSRAAYAVTPDSNVEEVEYLMASQQIRRVPVVDAQHRPIGMVAINDLVRDAAASTSGLFDRRVIRTLAAIGMHRQPQPIDQAA